MYKYFYYPDTRISSNLGRGSAYLSIDMGLYEAIKMTLGSDDWTYVRLAFGKQVEIVKIIERVNVGVVRIERAQDGTTQETFPIGSELSIVPTAAAVLDSVDTKRLVVETAGGVRYISGKIELPKINIVALGGVAKLNSATLGCCPVGNAPDIQLDLEPLRVTGIDEVRVTSDDEYRIYR